MAGERRARGVRLSDLDRSKVYLLAYVGKRWEVVGPAEGPAAGAAARAPATPAASGAATEAAPHVPRHRAVDPTRTADHT